MTQFVTPCIWIPRDAGAAIERYVQVIPNSRVVWERSLRDPDDNQVLWALAEIGGMNYQFLGGPSPFQLDESFSLTIECDDQAEVDHYWNALLEGGGEESVCGWLKDPWGVSWQVVPRRLGELMFDPNPDRAEAARQAMFGMRKIIIDDLEAAVELADAAHD